MAIASEAGSQSAVFPLLGMALCFVRLIGLHRDVNLPREPPEKVVPPGAGQTDRRDRGGADE
jgi:hypothetical protein